MSASFSPIIIVGALVLPEVIDGMIEASATRKLDIPCTSTGYQQLPYYPVPFAGAAGINGCC